MAARKSLSPLAIASFALVCTGFFHPCVSQAQEQVLPLSELIGKIHFLKPTREICQEAYFEKLERDLQYYVNGKRVSESQQEDMLHLIANGKKNCEEAHFMGPKSLPKPAMPAPQPNNQAQDSDLNQF
ncbi:MAG: hypothetical protein LUC43_03825 [Burkholderiales bacterium]|nr:hypothetical protein [Burkholderiales bacterium]